MSRRLAARPATLSRRLAARLVTGPPAFLLAGVIDLVSFAIASLRARRGRARL